MRGSKAKQIRREARRFAAIDPDVNTDEVYKFLKSAYKTTGRVETVASYDVGPALDPEVPSEPVLLTPDRRLVGPDGQPIGTDS